MKKFKIDKAHLGNLKLNVEEHGFNTIIISGPCQGNISDSEMVGRLVQVRKKSGLFGSDTVLIRTLNGTLMSFENQAFWDIDEKYKTYYDELFSEIYYDEPNREYSINDKHKAIGFIVNGMDCTDGRVGSMIISTDQNGNKTIK